MAGNWRYDIPLKPGMYEADFGEGTEKVYLWPCEDGINWGYNEHDDPEAVEIECIPGHRFRWRELSDAT